MSDEQVQPDVSSATEATPADGPTPDPAPAVTGADTPTSLSTELIEKQIDQAIDAANTVAEAIEAEVDDDSSDSDLELMGDFEAPDSATIEAATLAVEALHAEPTPNTDAQDRIEEEVQPEAEPVAAPSPIVETMQDTGESESTQTVALESQTAPTTQEAADANEPDESIEQIDAMLAEMAEGDFNHELEGEFHTVDQIVAGEDTKAQSETTEPVIGASADSEPTLDPVVTSAPAADTSTLAAATSATDAPATELEGSFDSIEDLLGGENPNASTSEPQSAESVEASTTESQVDAPTELTEPATTVPTMTTPPEVPAGSQAGEKRPDRPTIGARGRRLRELLVAQARQIERRALNGCAKVNHPMRFLHPEMRDTIGWVALAVAVPGVVFFTLGMIF